MIEINKKKYYTRNELASAFGVDKETISRWRREGRLKGYEVNKRRFIFCETDIEKLLGEKK